MLMTNTKRQSISRKVGLAEKPSDPAKCEAAFTRAFAKAEAVAAVSGVICTGRFIDNGDGTLTDVYTGLMWEKKITGGDYNTCNLTNLHLVNSACSWEQANGEWITALNTEAFAGYTDWRVPTLQELWSIIDYEKVNRAIDPAFGPTSLSPYWSATSVAQDSQPGTSIWNVDFIYGIARYDWHTNAYSVRAVRGGDD
jgi:hypothetical protein